MVIDVNKKNTELIHVVKDMPIDKQETLLRIAKAL